MIICVNQRATLNIKLSRLGLHLHFTWPRTELRSKFMGQLVAYRGISGRRYSKASKSYTYQEDQAADQVESSAVDRQVRKNDHQRPPKRSRMLAAFRKVSICGSIKGCGWNCSDPSCLEGPSQCADLDLHEELQTAMHTSQGFCSKAEEEVLVPAPASRSVAAFAPRRVVESQSCFTNQFLESSGKATRLLQRSVQKWQNLASSSQHLEFVASLEQQLLEASELYDGDALDGDNNGGAVYMKKFRNILRDAVGALSPPRALEGFQDGKEQLEKQNAEQTAEENASSSSLQKRIRKIIIACLKCIDLSDPQMEAIQLYLSKLFTSFEQRIGSPLELAKFASKKQWVRLRRALRTDLHPDDPSMSSVSEAVPDMQQSASGQAAVAQSVQRNNVLPEAGESGEPGLQTFLSTSGFPADVPSETLHNPRDATVKTKQNSRKKCIHNKLIRNCITCSGKACPHGKRPYYCIECSPCPHNRVKYECSTCCSPTSQRHKRCSHGKLQRHCEKCSGCLHGKLKQNCGICAACPHGKVKSCCQVCSGCLHGKVKRSCVICKGCPHGKLKTNCSKCYGCEHGKLKFKCRRCIAAKGRQKAEPSQEPKKVTGHPGDA
eukprot:TRINITY_DN4709_c0_g2_i1.p1 TRINITY_DN4709_c0_g2~~TRINITY_DN4709_c0_g2_i1.p1  ORF type:complete len:606 (+),score=93.35 TRINITY_DN4709_c0_g2_i1:116-1933(+)